jgi:hypothetical protein
MQKFEPILTAAIFNRIFSITTPLSECLHTCGLDLLQAWRMVRSALGKLETISRDFPTVLQEYRHAKKAKSKLASFDTDVAVEESLSSKATKRIPKRKLPFGEKDDTMGRWMLMRTIK